MAHTEVSICNMALLRAGHSQVIESLTETGVTAFSCKTFLPLVKAQLLEGADWSFARKRADLTTAPNDPPTNWAYSYSLPTDFLKVRGIVVDGTRILRFDQLPAFEVVGGELYCDLDVTEIIYTSDVDVSLFPASAVNALAWGLTAEFALSLIQDAKLASFASAVFERAILMAQSETSMDRQEQEPGSELIEGR